MYRNVHQLVNQFLECFINLPTPYSVRLQARRLKQINIRTEAEGVSENLINFDDVVLHVDAKLCEKKGEWIGS